jgi:hypothetical protein
MTPWSTNLITIMEEALRQMPLTELEKINLRITLMLLVSDIIFGNESLAYQLSAHSLRFKFFQKSKNNFRFDEPSQKIQIDLLSQVINEL